MSSKTLRPILLLILSAGICASSAALTKSVPSHRSRRTISSHSRRHHYHRFAGFLWNPMFRPSHESLLRQNEEIDRLELPRIQDDDELQRLIASGDLVPIVASESLRFDPRLDPDRRFCRPWTREFLDDLSDAYYKEFNTSIQVNSAVRTVMIQKRLRRHNRNAAPDSGDTASSHLAGITVDIQRRGMTRDQIRFVENYLLPLRDMGLVEPEEERHQWVFHIAVSGRYSDWRESQTQLSEQLRPSDPPVHVDEPSTPDVVQVNEEQ